MTQQQRLPDCTEILLQAGYDPIDVCDLARIFKALSDPTRLQMMLILSRNGGQVCVCDFERIFDLGQPTISHHLKILRKAGLLDCEKRGLWAYYFVQSAALEPLRSVLGVMTLRHSPV